MLNNLSYQNSYSNYNYYNNQRASVKRISTNQTFTANTGKYCTEENFKAVQAQLNEAYGEINKIKEELVDKLLEMQDKSNAKVYKNDDNVFLFDASSFIEGQFTDLNEIKKVSQLAEFMEKFTLSKLSCQCSRLKIEITPSNVNLFHLKEDYGRPLIYGRAQTVLNARPYEIVSKRSYDIRTTDIDTITNCIESYCGSYKFR